MPLPKNILIGLTVATPRRAGWGTVWCRVEDVSADGEYVILSGPSSWKQERRFVKVEDVTGYTESAKKKLAAWIAARASVVSEPIAFLNIPTADEPGRRKIKL